MNTPKKVYLSAMDTGRLGKPCSHMASNIYISVEHLQECINGLRYGNPGNMAQDANNEVLDELEIFIYDKK